MSWLSQIDYWHWLVLGILMIVLEVLSPGVYFLWLGAAAILVGGVLYWLPETSWQVQLALFAVFSLVSIALVRLFLARHPIESDEPTLNRRGEQYLGRVLTLSEPIENGIGRVKVDDTLWRVEGPDCPAGTQVRVVGVDGVVLQVEPA